MSLQEIESESYDYEQTLVRPNDTKKQRVDVGLRCLDVRKVHGRTPRVRSQPRVENSRGGGAASRRAAKLALQRAYEAKISKRLLGSIFSLGAKAWRSCKQFVVRHIGEDWLFLLVLGLLMAFLSFVLDYLIEKCQQGIPCLEYILI